MIGRANDDDVRAFLMVTNIRTGRRPGQNPQSGIMTLLTSLKNEKPAHVGTIRQLALFLALLLFSSSSALAYDCCIDGIYYNLDKVDKTAEVMQLGDNASVGDVVIPETINYNETTYPVTGIYFSVFSYCKNMTSVTIPKSVVEIRTPVIVGCSSLVRIVVDPDNAVYDSRDDCNAIIETATNKLIAGCKTTIIPNTVTIIGDEAFYDCSGLTSLTIPNSVTFIGRDAFLSASDLTNLAVESGNTTYDSRDNCNAIIETASSKLIVGSKNTLIPGTVTAIGDGAFYGCEITSITIPNSVASIGDKAFFYCTRLSPVIFPETLSSIGSEAFAGCARFTSVTIPSSVTFIGTGAFRGCGKLENIVVDSDNKTYDSRDNCNAIIETSTNKLIVGCGGSIIPNSATAIGDEAFECCPLNTMDIPNSVISIGRDAFHGCLSLISVTIPNSVTSIEDFAFMDCTSLSSVAFNAENCTQMGGNSSAFVGCKKLSSVTFGEEVTVIPPKAFKSCSGITSVNIPNSTISIGDEAFCNCTGLTSATIGESVTTIGGSTFSGCFGLAKLVSKAVIPPICGEGTFNGVDKQSCLLYVPEESFNQYKIADYWMDFYRTYGYSGVDDVSVGTQDAVYEVYNLQGVRVGGGMHEAEISADVLPHGVYILVSPQDCKKLKI